MWVLKREEYGENISDFVEELKNKPKWFRAIEY